MPDVQIPDDEQDPHSLRLLHVTDLAGKTFTPEQIKRARRAYYGAVSYVDDCVGKLLQTLKECKLDEDTIIVFSGDHGDMLGERNLWYKMSYFESSVRVPMLIHYPASFPARHISANVSTLDMLPTLADMTGVKLWADLPMDGSSLYPYLTNTPGGSDTVFAEYCGEGTVSPLMMIRRGRWKYITCPVDPPQLFNLNDDPQERINLAALAPKHELSTPEVRETLAAFDAEAAAKWNFEQITKDVLLQQRSRRLVWAALLKGTFTSWDYNPQDDGRQKYIRSQIPLDDLELRARFPPVDANGRDKPAGVLVVDQAGSHGQ